jgi:hypothetical protein
MAQARAPQVVTPAEYLAGRVFAMADASPKHNLICGNMIRALGERLRGRPCAIMPSDQHVYVEATELGTYPDVTRRTRRKSRSRSSVDRWRLGGDSGIARFRCGIEPLRWKRERRRPVTDCRLQGFETSRACKHRFGGVARCYWGGLLTPSRPNEGRPLPSIARGIPALTCADPSQGIPRVPRGSQLPNEETGLQSLGRA